MPEKMLTLIIQIVAPIIILACTGLLSIFIFLYIRKQKLNKYISFLDQATKDIKNDLTGRNATISRFATLSQSQERYKSSLSELKSLDKSLNTIIKDLNEKFYNLRKAAKSYKLKVAHKIYHQILPKYQECISLNKEFEEKTKNLNKHWNVIEIVTNESFSILRKVGDYLDKNKFRLKKSYKNLENELTQLRETTIEWENNKLTHKIDSISNALNQHEKRINIFARKVDHFVNIEWSLFDHLPKILNKLKSETREQSAINDLISEHQVLTNEWLELPYQDIQERIKKIYTEYYILNKKSTINKEFQDFINKELAKIGNMITKLDQKLSYVSIELDDYDQNFVAKISSELMQLKDQYDSIVTSKEKSSEVSLMEVQNLIEGIMQLVKNCNNKIEFFNYDSYQKKYNEYYLKMLETWSLKIQFVQSSVLEQSSELESDIKHLISNLTNVKRDFSQSGKLNFESKNWLSFYKIFNKLLKMTFRAYLYKKMTEELLSKSMHFRINNSDFNELLISVNKHMRAKRFDEAFSLLATCMKKEKKYVK
ncbi:hypothetical protein NPA07_01830 [Mycoplasmopsis caviae]|uniref:Septation ring formation regulator EzrA n=1 Tax=Mycoplasmopsis caviae TaxID=55603 RepID=A0A3P8L6N0_9BACT|nr:hypothetical protein [Mycoplasmopsis caviae]UUD35594.1 hypothetical protein NPA07_01830 [Mycoplasmopsis caviae]VDR41645.1 Uncharacterised protein [Mycoplasmopsis caviae]